MPDSLDDLALPDAHRSIETYLSPSLRGSGMEKIGALLAAGRLVAIREAFESAFAERMHRSLDACTTWQVYEKYENHFHFHHHNLYQKSEYPPDLAWCNKLFDSGATKAWAARLSGRPCIGPTAFSASWYLPGDYSLPHTDVAEATTTVASGSDINRQLTFNRQVAFVWHLAKHWRSEWGGALFWCPKALYLRPVFNTLVLFNVGPDTSHFVTQVSPYAQGKRLTINGWWTGPGPTATGIRAVSAPDRIDVGGASIEIY